MAWLPFIIVCIINYSGVLDTSAWYPVFSIIFLPINSIINPIGIYEDAVLQLLQKIKKHLGNFLLSSITLAHGRRCNLKPLKIICKFDEI